MKIEDLENRLKRWLLLLAGLVGIGYQQYTGEVNWFLLLVFTSMAGVPGIAEIILLIKNSPIVIRSSSSHSEPLELDSENLHSGSSENDTKT